MLHIEQQAKQCSGLNFNEWLKNNLLSFGRQGREKGTYAKNGDSSFRAASLAVLETSNLHSH